MTYSVYYRGKIIYFSGVYEGAYKECFSSGVFYEQRFLEYIAELALSGAYLDVGSNVGNHAVFFAAYCPSTVVHAFEPMPRYVTYLQENVRANSLEEKIRIHDFGLSDSAEKIGFSFSDWSFDFHPKALDQIELALDDVAVIKIDVKGAEARVLRGGQGVIQKHKPRIFCDATTPDELDRLDAVLNPLGYQLTGNAWNASPTYEWKHAAGR